MPRTSRLAAAPLLILLLGSVPPVSPSALPLASSPPPAAPGHNRPERSWSGLGAASGELAAFPECPKSGFAASLESPVEGGGDVIVSVPVGVKGRRRTLKIALEGNIAVPCLEP